MSEQRHDDVGAAIAATARTVEAPALLRAWVHETARRRPAVTLRPVAGGVLAVVVAFALVFLQAPGSGPSVQEVVAAALERPQRPVTSAVRVGAVRFPEYGTDYGWTAVGRREDRVGGRRAVTVVYRKDDRGVHYTVLDGRPIGLPGGARRVRAGGRVYAVLRDRGTAVVAWEQQGHTCVLASRAVGERELLRFASWG